MAVLIKSGSESNTVDDLIAYSFGSFHGVMFFEKDKAQTPAQLTAEIVEDVAQKERITVESAEKCYQEYRRVVKQVVEDGYEFNFVNSFNFILIVMSARSHEEAVWRCKNISQKVNYG